jgi:hypothetical protein
MKVIMIMGKTAISLMISKAFCASIIFILSMPAHKINLSGFFRILWSGSGTS